MLRRCHPERSVPKACEAQNLTPVAKLMTLPCEGKVAQPQAVTNEVTGAKTNKKFRIIRKDAGKNAIMILNLDGEIPADTLKELAAIDGIESVKQIKL